MRSTRTRGEAESDDASLRIDVGNVGVSAVLLDAAAPVAHQRLRDALPFQATARDMA